MKRLVFNGKNFVFLLFIVLVHLSGPAKAKSECFPAPWDLSGEMYIIMMAPQPDFVSADGFVPGYMQDRYDINSLAMVILVKYASSDVGPYNELMYIPGKFLFKDEYHATISKIYVDSWDSVIWGRLNWGIPKEFAKIEFNQLDDSEELVVTKHRKTVARIELKTTSDMYFPFSNEGTDLSDLAQHYYFHTLIVAPTIEGSMTSAEVIDWQFDPDYFPELSTKGIVSVLKVKDVSMLFPRSDIYFGID